MEVTACPKAMKGSSSRRSIVAATGVQSCDALVAQGHVVWVVLEPSRVPERVERRIVIPHGHQDLSVKPVQARVLVYFPGRCPASRLHVLRCYEDRVQSLFRPQQIPRSQKVSDSLKCTSLPLTGSRAISVKQTLYWNPVHFQRASVQLLQVCQLTGQPDRFRLAKPHALDELPKIHSRIWLDHVVEEAGDFRNGAAPVCDGVPWSPSEEVGRGPARPETRRA